MSNKLELPCSINMNSLQDIGASLGLFVVNANDALLGNEIPKSVFVAQIAIATIVGSLIQQIGIENTVQFLDSLKEPVLSVKNDPLPIFH